MAKNFKTLEAKMSPEARARSEAKAAKFINEMTLNELRTARALTQTTLAKKLRKGQPMISKIENSTDMYVSTLKEVIRGMGGDLQIYAIYPEGAILINQFGKIQRRKRKLVKGKV